MNTERKNSEIARNEDDNLKLDEDCDCLNNGTFSKCFDSCFRLLIVIW